MPIVKLRLGDLFDGPSDLLVLPCAGAGAGELIEPVARRLVHHTLPQPREMLAPGGVEILPFIGAEHLAQYVAFAADDLSAAPAALEAIGRALGAFTTAEPSVRLVAAPLLGGDRAAAQGEKVVAALQSGFAGAAVPDASLIVHVAERDVYERLKATRRRVASTRHQPMRVLIQHTSSSDAALDWVKQLALFLIDRGVQARLDRFHLRHGMDLPQWTCNELALADKVVVVCDEAYKHRADGRLGGVGWETRVLQGDLARLPADSTKYQVVVREEELSRGLPLYLRSRIAFHARPSLNDGVFRGELLRALVDPAPDECEHVECAM